MKTSHTVGKYLAKAEDARIVAEAMQDAECKRLRLAIGYGCSVMAVHSAYLVELLQERGSPAPLV